MKNVIVKTQALKKYYQTGNQTVRALDGVNFEVAEREFVSIVGKSGSGKSTLLHMIGGLDTPSSGTVNSRGGFICTFLCIYYIDDWFSYHLYLL